MEAARKVNGSKQSSSLYDALRGDAKGRRGALRLTLKFCKEVSSLRHDDRTERVADYEYEAFRLQGLRDFKLSKCQSCALPSAASRSRSSCSLFVSAVIDCEQSCFDPSMVQRLPAATSDSILWNKS